MQQYGFVHVITLDTKPIIFSTEKTKREFQVPWKYCMYCIYVMGQNTNPYRSMLGLRSFTKQDFLLHVWDDLEK